MADLFAQDRKRRGADRRHRALVSRSFAGRRASCAISRVRRGVLGIPDGVGDARPGNGDCRGPFAMANYRGRRRLGSAALDGTSPPIWRRRLSPRNLPVAATWSINGRECPAGNANCRSRGTNSCGNCRSRGANGVRQLTRKYFDTGRVQTRWVSAASELDRAFPMFVDMHQRRRKSLGQPGCYASKRFAAFHQEVEPPPVRRGQATVAVDGTGRPARRGRIRLY